MLLAYQVVSIILFLTHQEETNCNEFLRLRTILYAAETVKATVASLDEYYQFLKEWDETDSSAALKNKIETGMAISDSELKVASLVRMDFSDATLKYLSEAISSSSVAHKIDFIRILDHLPQERFEAPFLLPFLEERNADVRLAALRCALSQDDFPVSQLEFAVQKGGITTKSFSMNFAAQIKLLDAAFVEFGMRNAKSEWLVERAKEFRVSDERYLRPLFYLACVDEEKAYLKQLTDIASRPGPLQSSAIDLCARCTSIGNETKQEILIKALESSHRSVRRTAAYSISRSHQACVGRALELLPAADIEPIINRLRTTKTDLQTLESLSVKLGEMEGVTALLLTRKAINRLLSNSEGVDEKLISKFLFLLRQSTQDDSMRSEINEALSSLDQGIIEAWSRVFELERKLGIR